MQASIEQGGACYLLLPLLVLSQTRQAGARHLLLLFLLLLLRLLQPMLLVMAAGVAEGGYFLPLQQLGCAQLPRLGLVVYSRCAAADAGASAAGADFRNGT
jgi:hypothetical protein